MGIELDQTRSKLSEVNQALENAHQQEPVQHQPVETAPVHLGPLSTENTDSVPIFGYWNIRGLGAQCRSLLKFCGVNYQERKYNQHWDDANQTWDRSDWLNEKFNLGMEYPNLPYIFDEDVKLTETLAIMQYIAKKWKPELLGRNAAEVGRLHMLEYHVFMLKSTCTMPCYGENPDKDSILASCRPLLASIY